MPKGVYQRKPHTEEWKRNHSMKLKGHSVSEETREKQRIGNLGKKRSESTRKKLSELAKQKIGEKNHFFGKKHGEETKEKITSKHRGKCFSKPPLIKGEAHWNWKGGISPENHIQRTSQKAKLWKKAVFERDLYTCRWCGDKRGGNLNADHIKPWSLYPELRFEVSNGRTLCIPCHKKTDTYGSKCKRVRENGGS